MRFDATQDNKLQEFGAKSTALLGGLHPPTIAIALSSSYPAVDIVAFCNKNNEPNKPRIIYAVISAC